MKFKAGRNTLDLPSAFTKSSYTFGEVSCEDAVRILGGAWCACSRADGTPAEGRSRAGLLPLRGMSSLMDETPLER